MIRKASADDLDAVMMIEQASFSRPWSRKSFEAELFKASGNFLVCETDGEISGYIIFWTVLDEAEIADVAVAEKFKRQRIAEKLINRCIELNTDTRVIYLEVGRENEPAVRLYKKLGFNVNGEIKDYYGAGKNALRMSLELCRK
ncbi:MAG: ribosomal protein S18-alanine N-acetyltransferase [Deferribacterales bacterium]